MNYLETKLHREACMRLFQQLHQDDEPEWRRASGGGLCSLCGQEYRHHPYFDERTMHGHPIDHRGYVMGVSCIYEAWYSMCHAFILRVPFKYGCITWGVLN